MIKVLFIDVDGTLTNGRVAYTSRGKTSKTFNTLDGRGIRLIKERDCKVAFITSESSRISKKRARDLHVDYYIETDSKRLSIINVCQEMSIGLENVAAIGNDTNDTEMLELSEVSACPRDAHVEIKNMEGINVMTSEGGGGCVREFVDFLIKRGYV